MGTSKIVGTCGTSCGSCFCLIFIFSKKSSILDIAFFHLPEVTFSRLRDPSNRHPTIKNDALAQVKHNFLKKHVFSYENRCSEQLQKNNEREAVDGKRFLDFYNIDINDMKPYSIVINSTNMNADEVLNTVLSKINEK